METGPKPLDIAAPQSTAAPIDLPEENKIKPHRTPGEKTFDVFLYPFLTNFGVFAISVVATYWTTHGGDKNAAGQLKHGKLGKMFFERGEKLKNWLKTYGMSNEQADMSKMVFFSFADGTLMAPLVKLFEDRREGIARWIDCRLGTTPADDSVYKAEPKQTWLSVVGGRLLTSMIVVPTAYSLDKTGLNKVLFNDPGEKLGAYIAQKPNVKKFFGKWDVKELSRVSFFEGFYTSVCTAGLYASSRFIARRTGHDALCPAPETSAPSDHASPKAAEPNDYTPPMLTARAELHDAPKAKLELKRASPLIKPAGSFSEKHLAEQPPSAAMAI